MYEEQLALHTDKYQINMMYAHWKNGTHRKKSVFEVFFRKLPFGNGYCVFAGLERIVNYVNQLQFTLEEIAYLQQQEEEYDKEFLQELLQFRFTGAIRSVPEGTLIFPNEPVLQVEAAVWEAHLLETAILNFVNYQTLIATKASRIRRVAPEDHLLEFGTRRAQEADAAIWGARAAYLAGFDGTSNVRAGMLFGIPTKGTHAHAWVQDHANELEAFERFANALPNYVTLLVDTYDTLKSGVPNAIQIAKELRKQGKELKGIRLDSGDLAYLSIQARTMLDEAGFPDVKIMASSDLSEQVIFNLKAQNARIDAWGVGTQLITAADQPYLGGVYKLVAREVDGNLVPTIKISGNPEKVTTPGSKKLYRIINKQTGKSEADYIAMLDENLTGQNTLTLFDPVHTYLQKEVTNFMAIELLQPIFEQGQQVYPLPTLEDIRTYHRSQLTLFWDEYLRLLNPEKYPVDISQKVWDTKMELIRQFSSQKQK